MEKFTTEHFYSFTQHLHQVFSYAGLEIYEIKPQGRDCVIVFTENDFRLSLSLEMPTGIDDGRGYAENVAEFLIQSLEVEMFRNTHNGTFYDFLVSKDYAPQRFVRDIYKAYVEYATQEVGSRPHLYY
jgi:hypothetical protein